MKSALGFKKRILRSTIPSESEIKTSSNLTFPSGSDDVVLTIICLCDIVTVLSISQVSKRLRSLAFSREVWFALISDLHAHNFINCAPGQCIQDLTAEELVDLAKRTAQGPRSFSTTKSSGPVITHQIFLNPSFPPDDLAPLLRSATLLPGGRFVLLGGWGGVRCWSVQDDRLFWQYQGHWNSTPAVVEYDAEVIEGGEVAMIAIAVDVVVEGSHMHTRQFVDIIRLDLVHGTSFSVFLYLVKVSEQDPLSHLLVKICGDFAIVQVGPRYHEELILLRLSTQSCRSYSMMEFSYKVLLIPGYMVLADCKSSNSLYWKIFLHVWSMDSLMMHPTPGHELKAPPLIHQSIKLPLDRRFPTFFLSAYASPLQREYYTIWVACPGTPHVTRTTVNKFDLPLHVFQSQNPSLEQRLYRTYELPGTWHGMDMRISYSGHILRFNSLGGHKICSLMKEPQTTRLKRPFTHDKRWGKHECLAIDLHPFESHGSVQLSDYGGTMTFCQRRQIGIYFYE